MQRRAEPGDAVGVSEAQRHQRGAAAVFPDFVIKLLEAALRPRHSDDMRAGLGKRPRGGMADAAGGAGDESDTGGEGLFHSRPLPSCPTLCRATTSCWAV